MLLSCWVVHIMHCLCVDYSVMRPLKSDARRISLENSHPIISLLLDLNSSQVDKMRKANFLLEQ